MNEHALIAATPHKSRAPNPPRLASAGGHVAFGLLLLAGASKSWDVPRFLDALQGWTLLPAASRPVVALAIPTMELALACWWFLSRSTAALTCGLALVVVFTGAYVAQAASASPPACGCLSLRGRAEALDHSVPAVLARNGLLMAMLVLSLVTRRRSAPDSWPAPQPSASTGSHSR